MRGVLLARLFRLGFVADFLSRTVSQTLRDVIQELSAQGVTLAISGLPPQVKLQFDRDGLSGLIGDHNFFCHLEEALDAFNHQIQSKNN